LTEDIGFDKMILSRPL